MALLKGIQILGVLHLCLVTGLKNEVALEGAKSLSVNIRIKSFIK